MDKVILKNGGTKPVPDCYRNHKMCNKAVDNYAHALEYVPKCYKSQNTAVDTYSSTIQFVPDEYKTQKICDKAVDTYPFVFDSVHD